MTSDTYNIERLTQQEHESIFKERTYSFTVYAILREQFSGKEFVCGWNFILKRSAELLKIV